ncbi:hypothetical protein AI3057V1_1464 [Citrobacter freundii]|uniref:hypothetical protein n=1 Tax=Citrobacter freundii TaxID=546 RepID=UPI001D3B916A|nr:hypothetical protein [Citrobacter freundii]CAG0338772.1 hypothetical protein AI3057V1_1464 [Citrobacter freundii]CAH6019917.1 hypothetical protein AI3057V1_1464 [Citrobacter freundii]
MSKTSKQPAAAELNAEDVANDLNAEGITSAEVVTADVLDAGGESADSGSGSEGDDSGGEESDAPEFVVLAGNSVRHNGAVYRENNIIPVTGKDAERLLNAGIIADVSVLRQRILAAKPAVTVTTG